MRWKKLLSLSLLPLALLEVNLFAQGNKSLDTDSKSSLILKQDACPVLKPYRELNDFARWYFPESLYEEVRAQTRYTCSHIWYSSDGTPVSGYVVKPKSTEGQLWPVILYARGGTGDFGVIDDIIEVEFLLLAREGFVIVATDYRWTGEASRRDEWGGKDVDDLLNLVPLAKSLGYVDPERMFLLGGSRGGAMVYMAVKRGIPVKAAAVFAGVSDLEAFAAYRPEFVNGDEGYDGWAKVWPDFEHRKKEHFAARSAVAWAGQLNVPLLILHSRIDKKVPVSQALAIAEKLAENKKEYELVIYSRDGHSLPLNRTDRNQRIVRWFRSHEPNAVMPPLGPPAKSGQEYLTPVKP